MGRYVEILDDASGVRARELNALRLKGADEQLGGGWMSPGPPREFVLDLAHLLREQG